MIRKLTLLDFENWKALRIEGIKNNPESFGETYQQVLNQNISHLETSLKNGQIFAYEEGEQMSGLIGTYTLQPDNMKHRINLFGLYVRPKHRRKNIGNQLVQHVINNLSLEHKQIRLSVTTNNNTAIALYKKNGFEIYGTGPKALKIDGQYFDEYLMIRHD